MKTNPKAKHADNPRISEDPVFVKLAELQADAEKVVLQAIEFAARSKIPYDEALAALKAARDEAKSIGDDVNAHTRRVTTGQGPGAKRFAPGSVESSAVYDAAKARRAAADAVDGPAEAVPEVMPEAAPEFI